MPNFVRLTSFSGKPIYVNMDAVNYFTGEAHGASIFFASGAEATLDVQESADTVGTILKQSK